MQGQLFLPPIRPILIRTANSLQMKYLFIIGGVVFVVVRSAIYLISKSSQKMLMNKIKKDPSKALEYATDLNIPYAKRENCNAQSFELIKNKMGSSSKIGAYQILHVQPVDDNQFLVFTELSFTDFDVNVTGRSSDVK